MHYLIVISVAGKPKAVERLLDRLENVTIDATMEGGIDGLTTEASGVSAPSAGVTPCVKPRRAQNESEPHVNQTVDTKGLASDLAGRVTAATDYLTQAGYLLTEGEERRAWGLVVLATEALAQRGGLSQAEAAVRAAAFVETCAAAQQPAELFAAHAGVVSAAWDAGAGWWRVEVFVEGYDQLWVVALINGAVPEVIGEI